MAHDVASTHGEHEPTTTGLNHRKMLMWAFLGSDCMFFGSLIATYLVYKNRSITGPMPIDVFDIPVTTVSTFVLLMSSMSMVIAYSMLTQNKMKAFRIWLGTTVILGSTFVGFQVFEFRTFANHEVKVDCAHMEDLTALEQKVAEKCTPGVHHVEEVVPLTPRVNLFGTTFFTLTNPNLVPTMGLGGYTMYINCSAGALGFFIMQCPIAPCFPKDPKASAFQHLLRPIRSPLGWLPQDS